MKKTFKKFLALAASTMILGSMAVAPSVGAVSNSYKTSVVKYEVRWMGSYYQRWDYVKVSVYKPIITSSGNCNGYYYDHCYYEWRKH